VRPFPVALGYLLGGFAGFQHLGQLQPAAAACLVFGEDTAEASIRRAAGILDQWSYRNPLRSRHRLRGMFSQALLISRSPRLEDLTTEAFAALRAHPANSRRYSEMLYALQGAFAGLGCCDPPVRTGFNHAPGIEGTGARWAACVERWHATSALTPRVRTTARAIMAKAGRWLAAHRDALFGAKPFGGSDRG
jgi:hypothetical protein